MSRRIESIAVDNNGCTPAAKIMLSGVPFATIGIIAVDIALMISLIFIIISFKCGEAKIVIIWVRSPFSMIKF